MNQSMYRKDASLMQFEQGLNKLDRNEVKNLESELQRLCNEYQNPTNELALLRENSIYNTELLEQKLELVREKKQFLNEKFKIKDEIGYEQDYLEIDRAWFRLSAGLTGSASLVMLGFYEILPEPGNIFAAFGSGLFAILTALSSGVHAHNYIKTKRELKKLEQSPEYQALQESEKQKSLGTETEEIKRLPSIDKCHLTEVKIK